MKEKKMAKNTESVPAAQHAAGVVEAAPTAPVEYPGRTMGVVSLVLSFFFQIPALILGIIAWLWSSKAGVSNVPAKVAVAVSSALLVLGLLALIGWVILIAGAVDGVFNFDSFDQMGRGLLRS